MSEAVQPTSFSHEEATSAISSLLASPKKESKKEQPVAKPAVEETVDDSYDDEGDLASHDEDYEDDSAEDYNDDEHDDVDEGDDDDEPVRASIDDEEFEVIVNGEPLTVKGSELKNGYMRQADYSRKSQDVAAQRKELDAQKIKVMEQSNVVRFQAHNKLAQLEEAVGQVGGWGQLRANYEPEQVEQFTQMYVQAQKEASYADELISNYHAQIKENNTKDIQRILKDMSRTYNGFNNDTINQLDSYLTQNGFSEDMALSMTHPQAWDMVYKAMLYDKAQSRSRKDEASSKQVKREGKKNISAPSAPVQVKQSSSRRISKATQALREANKSNDNFAKNRAGVSAIAALLKAKS